MASQLAKKIVEAVVIDHSFIGDIDERRSIAGIDAKLQEVRSLIADVAALETSIDDEYQIGQRARALMEKLSTQEK
jgi:hypothetical protein